MLTAGLTLKSVCFVFVFYCFCFFLFSFLFAHTHTHTHTQDLTRIGDKVATSPSAGKTPMQLSPSGPVTRHQFGLRSLHELKRHDLNQHSTDQRRCGASRAWTTSKRHLDLRMCEFYVCAYPGSIPLGFFCANGSFALVFFSAHSFTCPSKDAFCIDEWCRSE